MHNKAKQINIKTIVFWLFFSTAIGFIADGSAIYAKAHLAKYLISDAWEQTLTGKTQVKPWPWADTWPVAQLSLPEQGIKQYVLSGASGASLPFGPGHLTGTALPGESGNSIIAAHRDTHFNFLKNSKIGEHIQIQTQDNKTISYTIIHTEIVDSRKHMLHASAQSNLLTLITCYPFDVINPGGPWRYVVTALAIDIEV